MHLWYHSGRIQNFPRRKVARSIPTGSRSTKKQNVLFMKMKRCLGPEASPKFGTFSFYFLEIGCLFYCIFVWSHFYKQRLNKRYFSQTDFFPGQNSGIRRYRWPENKCLIGPVQSKASSHVWPGGFRGPDPWDAGQLNFDTKVFEL